MAAATIPRRCRTHISRIRISRIRISAVRRREVRCSAPARRRACRGSTRRPICRRRPGTRGSRRRIAERRQRRAARCTIFAAGISVASTPTIRRYELAAAGTMAGTTDSMAGGGSPPAIGIGMRSRPTLIPITFRKRSSRRPAKNSRRRPRRRKVLPATSTTIAPTPTAIIPTSRPATCLGKRCPRRRPSKRRRQCAAVSSA